MSCKIKVVAVGTSACIRCKTQRYILPETIEVEYLDFDIKADKQKAVSLYGVKSADEVPTFLLYLNDELVHQAFNPIPPARIAMEYTRLIKNQEENQ